MSYKKLVRAGERGMGKPTTNILKKESEREMRTHAHTLASKNKHFTAKC